jgi:hypothetical protein
VVDRVPGLRVCVLGRCLCGGFRLAVRQPARIGSKGAAITMGERTSRPSADLRALGAAWLVLYQRRREPRLCGTLVNEARMSD